MKNKVRVDIGVRSTDAGWHILVGIDGDHYLSPATFTEAEARAQAKTLSDKITNAIEVYKEKAEIAHVMPIILDALKALGRS